MKYFLGSFLAVLLDRLIEIINYLLKIISKFELLFIKAGA